MMKVCDNLRWYIHDRLTHNPHWQGVSIILSDGSVPGEGEHKVMDFIRRQRTQPDYNPNTTYVKDSIQFSRYSSYSLYTFTFQPMQVNFCLLLVILFMVWMLISLCWAWPHTKLISMFFVKK